MRTSVHSFTIKQDNCMVRAKEFANDILEIESFNKVLKKERLKANQYFHKTGEWNKWIEFLRSNI